MTLVKSRILSLISRACAQKSGLSDTHLQSSTKEADTVGSLASNTSLTTELLDNKSPCLKKIR